MFGVTLVDGISSIDLALMKDVLVTFFMMGVIVYLLFNSHKS